MRISYEISWHTAVSVLLFIIGMLIGMRGFGVLYGSNHASGFPNLDRTACREGKYVSGEIDSCLVKQITTAGAGRFWGESGTLLRAGKEYHFYTIPIADGQYIQIMAWKKETTEALQELVKEERETVSFTGVIAAHPLEISLHWYQGIPGFQPETLVQEYVLRETDPESGKNLLIVGGIVLFTAVLLYWQSGGIKRRVLEPERFDKIERFYADSYNKENELALERSRMSRLMSRKRSFKIRGAAGGFCLPVGILLVMSAHFHEGKLAGILLIIYALKKIGDCFWQSDLTLAVKIAGIFEKRTLHDEIEDCELRIAILEDLLGGETKDDMEEGEEKR